MTEWNDTPTQPIRLSDLDSKIAVVTGSSMGIGKAVAALLLENNAKVFGLARGRGELDHPGLIHVTCDLSDATEIERAFAFIGVHASRVDYVVNVAGIDPKYAIDSVSVEQWDELVDLNLRAFYFVIKPAMPLLRTGEGKSIVNVSSINYRLDIPGRAAYSATKAGILGLTTGLSRELGREGIHNNTVSPSWIFTERQIKEYFDGDEAARHLEYLGQQQSIKIKITATDVANHILFDLSRVSRASTVHNCVVDGGWLLE